MNKTNKKKINFKPKSVRNEIDNFVDQWVNESASKTENSFSKNTAISNSVKHQSNIKDEFKFTLVIPTYLHRRIKKYCAIHGISIKEKLTEIFEKEFSEV